MTLRELLKGNPVTHGLGRWVIGGLDGLRMLPGFLAQRRIRRQGPIRVGFFCQYIPAWTKYEPLYRIMQENPRFKPYLLCLPSAIQGGQLTDPDCLENDTYNYFLAHGYPEAINVLTGRDQWLDLEQLQLDYVCYPRPYNALVPACYDSHRICRRSRIFHILYGINMDVGISKITMNRDFMNTVAIYFAELPSAGASNRKNFWLGHLLGLQKSPCLGMPVLEELANYRNSPSPSWDFSKNSFRVIWTPRWTSDPAEGGTNFFRYWKRLPDYAQRTPDMDLLIRPHPLTFAHFIQTGEMTQEDVDGFKARCQALPNVQLDPESQYEATLWNSSVLVSDFSSLMVEYFYTGKPIVFCPTEAQLELLPFTRRMIQEGCYIAKDEQELLGLLEQLKSGEDPLAPVRRKLAKELLGDQEHAAARIVEALAADCGR